MQTARETVARHDRVSHMANRLAVQDFVPCILHVEMRVSEKLTHSLFVMGMDRCLDGDSATHRRMVDHVTDCMNKIALGDPATGRLGQWHFPLKDNNTQVEPRSMTSTTSAVGSTQWDSKQSLLSHL